MSYNEIANYYQKSVTKRNLFMRHSICCVQKADKCIKPNTKKSGNVLIEKTSDFAWREIQNVVLVLSHPLLLPCNAQDFVAQDWHRQGFYTVLQAMVP